MALFAASEVGVWYDPSDFSTMYASAGSGTTTAVPVTAVEQTVGFILDKSQGATLGPELVENGDFSSDTTTGWTEGLGGSDFTFVASGGVATLTMVAAGPGSGRYKYTIPGLTVGRYYRVSFQEAGNSVGTGDRTIIWTSSSAGTGGTNLNLVVSGNWTNETKTYFLQATATTMYLAVALSATATAGSAYSIDNISVREIPGNHAIQATSGSRPVLRARYNLLTYSEDFGNAGWSKFGSSSAANTTAVNAPDGTQTADLYTSAADGSELARNITIVSGVQYKIRIAVKYIDAAIFRVKLSTAVTADAWFNIQTGTLGTSTFVSTPTITSVGDGWYVIEATFTAASTTLGLAFMLAAADNSTAEVAGTCYLWGADLRANTESASLPAYQRIAAATDYDTNGFPPYLLFDGSDDGMATAAIDFSATDEMTVVAGVRKLSDAAFGAIAGISADPSTTVGVFEISASSNLGDASRMTYAFISGGDPHSVNVRTSATDLPAPLTNVVSGLGDISSDTMILRVDGTQRSAGSADQGSGNYGNHALYLGRRGGSSSSYNGRLYSLIVRGKTSTADEIALAEAWVNSKTRAY